MFSQLLNKLSSSHQAILALVLGAILFLGAIDKLGILQNLLNTVMLVTGAILVLWALSKMGFLSFKR